MLAAPVLAAGITHLTDARYFAAWEVSYLAFPLGEGEGTIGWAYLDALREWVAGPEIVAELGVSFPADETARQLGERGIHLALVPALTPAPTPQKLRAAGIEVWLQLPVEGYQSVEDIAEAAAAHPAASGLLLDFTAGGITWADLEDGHPFRFADLSGRLGGRKLFLRIDPDRADPKGIAAAHPGLGFAVRGSGEEKVGYKSFDDLDGFFEALEIFE